MPGTGWRRVVEQLVTQGSRVGYPRSGRALHRAPGGICSDSAHFRWSSAPNYYVRAGRVCQASQDQVELLGVSRESAQLTSLLGHFKASLRRTGCSPSPRRLLYTSSSRSQHASSQALSPHWSIPTDRRLPRLDRGPYAPPFPPPACKSRRPSSCYKCSAARAGRWTGACSRRVRGMRTRGGRAGGRRDISPRGVHWEETSRLALVVQPRVVRLSVCGVRTWLADKSWLGSCAGRWAARRASRRCTERLAVVAVGRQPCFFHA